MSKTGKYQDTVPGKPKDKRRNIRFDEETYDLIRQYAADKTMKGDRWTFSRVVGEAVQLFLQLQPYLGDAIKKTKLLAGKRMVVMTMRNDLARFNIELDEALSETEDLSTPDTKE